MEYAIQVNLIKEEHQTSQSLVSQVKAKLYLSVLFICILYVYYICQYCLLAAELLSEVCHNVEVEPNLQPLSDETFQFKLQTLRMVHD